MSLLPAPRELLGKKLRLRPELVVTPDTTGEADGYLVEDPATSKFFRIGATEYALISLLDGTVTVARAARLAADAVGLDQRDALAICNWTVRTGLVHDPADSELAPATSPRPAKFNWWRLNLIIIRIPLVRPDRLFSAVEPWLGCLFSRVAGAVWCLVAAVACFQTLSHWDRFTAATSGILAPSNWVWLLAIGVVLKVLHEAAHGIVCKRYGGWIAEAGLILVLFAPLAYVDVTSSGRFRSRWPRMHTALAGMYVEVFVAAVAAIIWSLSTGLVAQIALNTITMAGFSTLVFNANPLMRFDGYYLLSDLVRLPNLYPRGQQFTRYLLRRYALGLDDPDPVGGRRGWLVRMYAIAAAAWRLFVSASLIIAASGLFHGAGLVLSVVAVVAWIAGPLARLAGTARSSLGRRRYARPLAFWTVAAALFAAVVAIPLPEFTHAHGVVEYSPLTIVRAGCDGWITEVLVTGGQQVVAGQELARLTNESLAAELRELDLEIQQSETRKRMLETQSQISAAQAEQETLHELLEKRRVRRLEAGRLVVTAPRAGRIISRRLDALEGVYVEVGDVVLSLANEHEKQVRFAVGQRWHQSFENLPRGDLSLSVRHAATLPCRLTKIEPQATFHLIDDALGAPMGGPLAVRAASSESHEYELVSPHFVGVAALEPDPSRALRAGQRVRVTARAEDTVLATRLGRWIADWVAGKVAARK